MIKLPTREDFERLVKINTERNEWNHEYYAHLPARQQWDAWQAAIAEVQRLNATAQPVSDGWVKCSDRMPEEMSDVLATDGKDVKDMWWNGKKWDSWPARYSLDSDSITHWTPKPAEPGGQDD